MCFTCSACPVFRTKKWAGVIIFTLLGAHLRFCCSFNNMPKSALLYWFSPFNQKVQKMIKMVRLEEQFFVALMAVIFFLLVSCGGDKKSMYVFDSQTTVSRVGAVYYGFDVEREVLLQYTNDVAQSDLVLSTSDVDKRCTRFSGLQILDGTDLLVVVCDQDGDSFTHILTLVNPGSQMPVFSVADTYVDLNERIRAVGSDQLLYRNNSVSFTLLNLKSYDTCFFEIVDEDLNYEFQSGFFVDGSKVFVRLQGLNWEKLSSFDLGDIETCGESQLTAFLNGNKVFAAGPVAVFDGSYYFIDSDSIAVLSSESLDSLAIQYLGDGISPLQQGGSMDLVSQSESVVILRSKGLAKLYKLDLDSGIFSSLD